MLYSNCETSIRNSFWNSIRGIAKQKGLSLYGSFLTGNFHLDSQKLFSMSDIDLFYETSYLPLSIEKLKSEISRSIGICLKISIRDSLFYRQLTLLPEHLSVLASSIDSLIKLYEHDFHEEQRSYIISKFLLRTLYKEEYFSKCLLDVLEGIDENMSFSKLVSAKLYGDVLDLEVINHYRKNLRTNKYLLASTYDLLTSCFSYQDLLLFWNRQSQLIRKHHFFLLSEIEAKISTLNRMPDERNSQNS